METKIKEIIQSYCNSEEDMQFLIDEAMIDFIDYEQMEEEGIESEHDYYADYGRGEAEDQIHNEILRLIAREIKEPIDNWYFSDKYGDINQLIYDIFPNLEYR
jgi:hypothetical protein